MDDVQDTIIEHLERTALLVRRGLVYGGQRTLISDVYRQVVRVYGIYRERCIALLVHNRYATRYQEVHLLRVAVGYRRVVRRRQCPVGGKSGRGQYGMVCVGRTNRVLPGWYRT